MAITIIIANVYWVPTLCQLCILLGLRELSPLILKALQGRQDPFHTQGDRLSFLFWATSLLYQSHSGETLSARRISGSPQLQKFRILLLTRSPCEAL